MFNFDWKVYSALALVLFLMALPVLHRKLYGAVPEIDASKLLQTENNFRLIDLRSAKDYQASHIENAVNIPCTGIGQHQQKLHELIIDNDSKKQTVLVCETDLLSTRLGKKLIDMGCENIYILKGGFNYWKRKRLPLIQP